ncbi:MAG: extracellular solute-binding protein [Eubacteriales bacterium]|nr:extracellular solute-binding protein [Eubacteriales bacterium]
MSKKGMKRRAASTLLAVSLAGTAALGGTGIAACAEDAGDVTTLSIYIDATWWPTDKWEGIIPEEITNRTGVALDVTVATDESQLGLMIASDELPDLVFTDREINRLSDSKFCYPLEELITEYCPENADVFDDTRKAIGTSLGTDGNYYAILNVFNTSEEMKASGVANGQCVMVYRQDIYEALGSPQLETMDDLMNVLKLCKEQYPDMVPLQLGGVWKLQSVATMLGAIPSQDNSYGYNSDGSVVYYSSGDNYYDYLKYANEMARNGLITAEAYASENETDNYQVLYNGNAFMMSMYLKGDDLGTQMARMNVENPDLRVLPCLGEGQVGTGKGWCGTFITKACQDPEAAIKFLTFLYSEEGQKLSKFGREGIEWTEEDGQITFSEEFLTAIQNDDTRIATYNNQYYLGCDGVKDVMTGFALFSEENKAAALTYMEDSKSAPEIGVSIPNTTSDEGIIAAKLNDAIPAEEAKVIFAASDEEFEAAYEQLQKVASQIGVEQLNEYMTQTVEENCEKFGFEKQ